MSSFKEKFFNEWFSLRQLFLYGNMALFVFFLLVVVKDQKRGWKDYQDEFKRREITRSEQKLAAAKSDDEKVIAERELHAAKGMKTEIRQMWVQNINAVDRCVTCHLGYDPLANSSLTTPYPDHPFSAPSNTVGYEIHKLHNFDKFGCVICHGGQGLATEVAAAHGNVEHWESPLLRGALIQASCFKCHDNINELNVGGKNFTAGLVHAKQLIRENGCLGCHQIGGEGGPISVDLKEETSGKSLSRIDFNYTGLPREEYTLANWIKLHLVKDPVKLVPGDPEAKFNTEPIAPSAMPPFLMAEEDANDITAYILGLNRKSIRPEYFVLRPAEPKPNIANAVQRGRYVYEEFGCAGCHGSDARGGVRVYNYQYDVSPNLRRSVATYTREELADKIQHGVPILAKNNPHGPNPPLYMPAWKDKIKGQDLDALIAYLQSIKE